jgi:FHS family L-fucose permease-like MFS transporter
MKLDGGPEKSPLVAPGNLTPFILVTVLFFLWGVPNNLNDVLIRQFMKSFVLNRFQAGLVQSAFYLGYFLFALPAALFMRRRGYKSGFVTGLMLFGFGTFLFWPAAIVARYSFFLFALFVIASGLAFLETAANPFIAQLGDPKTSERRLNFSQAFNPLGSITGILIGTVFIFSGIELRPDQVSVLKASHQYGDYLKSETFRVVEPYMILGLVAIAWGILILRTKFPAIQVEHEGTDEDYGHARELLKYRHFLLAVPTLFVYNGTQVGTWSYFIQYVQGYTHQPEKIAGYLLTGTLAAFGAGRFFSSWLMKFFRANRVMGVYALVNIGLVSLGVLFPGWLGVWAILLTSFFMSVMFPTIFALGVKELGPNTKIGGSFIIMGIVGGAVLTPAMGLISEIFSNIAIAYLIPLFGYVVVALYAFKGSRVSLPATRSIGGGGSGL